MVWDMSDEEKFVFVSWSSELISFALRRYNPKDILKSS